MNIRLGVEPEVMMLVLEKKKCLNVPVVVVEAGDNRVGDGGGGGDGR
jgi:hypothetical protein